MKKFIIIAISAILLLSGCGVGIYSSSTGHDDKASISFITQGKSSVINVIVDGNSYQVKSVEQKAFKAKRNIRATAENTIQLTPGKHEVKASAEGRELFSKTLILNRSEHRYLEL